MSQKSNETPALNSWIPFDQGGSGAREAIETFVQAVTSGPEFVDPSERIAVFDNDGTLWSEKPYYFQKPFIDWRRERQVPIQEEPLTSFHRDVLEWIGTATHPDGGLYTDLVFQPMLELLRYLRYHQFKTYIVSGGGMEFVRPWAEAVYGIPPEQVIGSSVGTAYRDDPPGIVRVPVRTPGSQEDAGKMEYQELLFIDDKYGKPVGISNHIGRQPIAAFGNSDGDKQMLEWTTSGTGRRFGLLIHHTDAAREWQYDKDSEQGRLTQGTLDEAAERGWTVVDMARDWSHVSPPLPSGEA